MLHRPGLASSSLSSSSFSFGMITENITKQHELQIDFLLNHQSQEETEDHKDTGKFKSHLMILSQMVHAKGIITNLPEGRSILKISHKHINSSSALISADPKWS